MMDFIEGARPSPIAGSWYPGDPVRLAEDVNMYISNAVISDDEFSGKVFGIIAPHAGMVYSGKTAGYAYCLLKGLQKDIIVVLSPFHQYLPADVITTAYAEYKTPLGSVPVDTGLINSLETKLADKQIQLHQVKNDPEHALEIQLPFLQETLKKGFLLLPLMVRTRDAVLLRSIVELLMEVLHGKRFLIVASTDLSHFFPLETAQQMDAEMLRRIKAMDADMVLSAETEGTASACGASAVALLLMAAREQEGAKTYILNYSTSAHVTGDESSVVGYGAGAVFI